MQPHLTLNILDLLVKTITITQLPAYCIPIKYALTQLMCTNEGQFFRQSFSSYFAYIDFFEHLLDKEKTIRFSVHTSGIFMFLMLQGHSVLSGPANNFIAEAQGNSCAIKHMSAGAYSRTLFKGEHKILILTLRPDWFISVTQNLELFRPLIKNYQEPVKSVFSLPRCPIKAEILKPLKKLLEHDGSDRIELSRKIHDFSSRMIYDYHQMLQSGRLMTEALHQAKANDIALFIRENYADPIVNDVPRLALQFSVSRSLFLDLCKVGFKKPLHKYVIDLRMNYGLLFLITTTQSVAEVAFQVGYSDPRYFSKEFKKYHGISPAELQGLCM